MGACPSFLRVFVLRSGASLLSRAIFRFLEIDKRSTHPPGLLLLMHWGPVGMRVCVYTRSRIRRGTCMLRARVEGEERVGLGGSMW